MKHFTVFFFTLLLVSFTGFAAQAKTVLECNDGSRWGNSIITKDTSLLSNTIESAIDQKYQTFDAEISEIASLNDIQNLHLVFSRDNRINYTAKGIDHLPTNDAALKDIKFEVYKSQSDSKRLYVERGLMNQTKEDSGLVVLVKVSYAKDRSLASITAINCKVRK